MDSPSISIREWIEGKHASTLSFLSDEVGSVKLRNSLSMRLARGKLFISDNVNEDCLKAFIYFFAQLLEIRSCLAVCALLMTSAVHLFKSFRIVDVER